MAIAVASTVTQTVTGGGAINFTAAENDLVVMFCTSTVAGQSISSSGWTAVFGPSFISSNGEMLYAKRMGASPDTSIVIVDNGDEQEAVLYVLSGVDTSTFEDATRTTAATADPASITTVTDNAWVGAFLSGGAGTLGSVTAPSGYSNLLQHNGAAGIQAAAAWKQVSPAGAENPGSFGCSSSFNECITWAVRPALGGTAAITGTAASGTTEAHIVSGGRTIIITLTGDTWVASGATFDAQRQNIINGIDSAQAEGTGWDAVVKAGLAVGDVVRTSDTVVTVTLPAFASYNITATETITVTIPATAVTLAAQIVAGNTFTVITVPFATISGTCVPSTTEASIVAGGKTIIITLDGDTWVASGATFDAQRQNIINGLDSAQAEAAGWDAEVKAKLAVTTVVRTSNTVVTVTLSAQAGYNITVAETITVTVPATALTAGGALVGSPTFTVNPPATDTGSSMTYVGAISRRRGR